MSRSSGRRGQVEPLAALAAVAVLGLALSAYAVAHRTATPAPTARDVAADARDRAVDVLRTGAAIEPSTLTGGVDVAPAGFDANVTVRGGGHAWSAGPSPPPDASAAARTVPVRVRPGLTVPGRLRVEVWR